MSLPPILISALDPAGVIDRANDLLVLRQGLNDKKATVEQVSRVQLADYAASPNPLSAADVLLVGKPSTISPGTYDNYIVPLSRVGFGVGTACWFYQATPPLGWDPVPGTGDRILGTVLVGGGLNTYNATGLAGSWQQKDHTLTIAQMPAHYHSYKIFKSDSENHVSLTKISATNKDTFYTSQTDVAGGSEGHNHGSDWRPAGAIGVIGIKTA